MRCVTVYEAVFLQPFSAVTSTSYTPPSSTFRVALVVLFVSFHSYETLTPEVAVNSTSCTEHVIISELAEISTFGFSLSSVISNVLNTLHPLPPLATTMYSAGVLIFNVLPVASGSAISNSCVSYHLNSTPSVALAF